MCEFEESRRFSENPSSQRLGVNGESILSCLGTDEETSKFKLMLGENDDWLRGNIDSLLKTYSLSQIMGCYFYAKNNNRILLSNEDIDDIISRDNIELGVFYVLKYKDLGIKKERWERIVDVSDFFATPNLDNKESIMSFIGRLSELSEQNVEQLRDLACDYNLCVDETNFKDLLLIPMYNERGLKELSDYAKYCGPITKDVIENIFEINPL